MEIQPVKHKHSIKTTLQRHTAERHVGVTRDGSDKKRKKKKKLRRDAIADISCLAKNIGDSANRTARHEWLQNKKNI